MSDGRRVVSRRGATGDAEDGRWHEGALVLARWWLEAADGARGGGGRLRSRRGVGDELLSWCSQMIAEVDASYSRVGLARGRRRGGHRMEASRKEGTNDGGEGSPQTLVGGAALVADGAVASGERRCGEEIYQCGGVASAEVDARGSEASQSWGSCPATVGGRCGRSECTQSPLCAQAERRKENDGGDRIRRCRRRWWHWWMLLRCSQRELAWTSTAVGGRSCGGGMSVQRGRRCTER